MKVASLLYREGFFETERNDEQLSYDTAQLVLGFGARELVSDTVVYSKVKEKFPAADVVLCSSSGEISETEVLDDCICFSVLQFSSTVIKTAQINIKDFSGSFEAGKALTQHISPDGLKLILVISDGGLVNGSELVNGINAVKAENVLVTGGLAGDAARFEKTVVGINGLPQQGQIVAVAFYGEKLMLSHGSLGGWESFGLERTVTKSKENVLSEIDNKNVLELYKNYLGRYADELPGSALLFPLAINIPGNAEPIVRTILSIDEQERTMTFAGDIPEGSKVRFMKANFDRLIDAASGAASACLEMNSFTPKLALLISCVGRKLILGNRIDEEVEAVSEIFGSNTVLSGFYSYGEISPVKPLSDCVLHNQTMTVTALNEID